MDDQSPVPVPVNPTPDPPPQRERAKEYQLTTIAQLSTMGTPPGTISQVTGLSESYVNRLLSGHSKNETFNKLHEQYKEKNLRTLVGSRFKLADKIDDALDVVGNSLHAQDQRLCFEAAKWLWAEVMPDLKAKNGTDGSDTFQLTINQPHVQTQIGETMANVAKSLLGLRDAISTQELDAHVKLGTDALPIPPSQLEVTAGSAQIDPDRGTKTDLLTELIERDDDG